MNIQRFARVDATDPIDSRAIAMIAVVPNYRGIQGGPSYAYMPSWVPIASHTCTRDPLVFGRGSIISPERFVDIDFVG